MAVLRVSSKVLSFALFLYLLSLGSTIETSGNDGLEIIKELQKRLDHLETLLISLSKEQVKIVATELSSKLESLESKYDARFQKLESRLDIAFECKTRFPTIIEQDSPRNEITSEFQLTQNEEPVFKVACRGFAEELKTSFRSFEEFLHSSMAKFEEARVTLFEAMSEISSIHSTVNSTWNELVDHGRKWNNVNKKNTQCKEGWYFFEDSCYYFSHTVGNWTYGRSQCLAMGGDYVKISTNGEWNFIASHITSDSWIGLSDTEEEGIYKWITDGSVEIEIDKAWWRSGQPDNHQGAEDCIHYSFAYNKKLWNDKSCETNYRYICEMVPESESA